MSTRVPGASALSALALRHGLLRRAALGLCILAGGLLLSSSPALAAGEVHHAYTGRMIKGEGTCTLAGPEHEPAAVAVNDTTKEVWVIDRAKSRVDRLSPTGECLSSVKVFAAEGIAVDQNTGDAYVAVAIEKESEERVAVDKFGPEGKLLRRIVKFKNAEGVIEPLSEHGPIFGIALDASGSLWIYQEEIIQHFSNGDPNTFVGSVTQELGSCSPRPQFAVSPNAEFLYVGKERETRNAEGCEEATVLVKLNSEGKPATQNPEEDPLVKAQLDNENTTGVAVDSSSGQVYFDNVRSVSSFDSAGRFVQRFANEPGDGQLQEGSGVAVDSASGDVYVADVRAGAVKVYSPTPPEPRREPTADGRGYEQVTPQNKLGASIYPISKDLGVLQASEDGSAITFVSNAPPVAAPPTNRAPEPTQSLSRRSPSSWSTEDIVAPAGRVPAGYNTGSGTEYEFFSPDLTSAIVNPQDHEKVFQNEPRLSPEATEGTPYLRDLTVPSRECEPVPSGCYRSLVWGGAEGNDLASPFEPFGGKVHVTSASPDARHVVLRSEVPLTAEASAHEGETKSGLYEAEAGGPLQLVSVLPAEEGGKPSTEGTDLHLGGPGENNGGVMRNAISNDGSRVIWSTEHGEGKLYLRDTVKRETIRLDMVPAAEKEEVEQPEAGAQYQTASTDGSRIFFTDTHRLTKNSAPHGEEEEEGGLGDLYVCEVEEQGNKDVCKLKDLTTEVRSGNEFAAVQGVLGASDNGTSVYYVADGALDGKSGRGDCMPAGRGLEPNQSCNLYVQRFASGAWQPPQFVASLSSQDQNDWHIEPEAGALLGVTARVSPNGEYVAFMSNRSLTGYNNVDTHEPAAHDQEVYLYHASPDVSSPGLVQCASCNPDGTPPTGVHDVEASGEGIGLVIDRAGIWGGQYLAANIPGWTPRSKESAVYQSRYLSNTGRLFFNSASPLVLADTNGKADVYEFEPNGEGSCRSASGCVSLISSGASPQESAFLDASTSGNDVFLLTSEKLVPQDLDTGFDIYDARVCTAGSPCITPPPPGEPCKEEGCKGAPTSVPAMPPVPPSSLAGTGNVGTHQVLDVKTNTKPKPLTRAQKLAKALKACKKIKKKSKRQACVRQANKKYGPVKKKSTSHKKGKK